MPAQTAVALLDATAKFIAYAADMFSEASPHRTIYEYSPPWTTATGLLCVIPPVLAKMVDDANDTSVVVANVHTATSSVLAVNNTIVVPDASVPAGERPDTVGTVVSVD